jgi:hypothetical protein
MFACRLVTVSLAKRRKSKARVNVADVMAASTLELGLTGWEFDYNFIIDAFLRERFY